jgi:hypothetical protein
VTPKQVGMSAAHIVRAGLHDNGHLFRCTYCGRVWEKYRDQLGEWAQMKIGTYDGPGPEVGFTPFHSKF